MRFHWLIAVTVSGLLAHATRVEADESSPANASGTNALKSIPRPPETSPVETFRKLLAMPPGEQEQFLAHYPPERRQQILEKVREYRRLPVELRELRLRVTELRWYLLPLLKARPEQRAELLKSVPEPCREMVTARLEEWDIWPPDLKAEVLEYETTMHYLVGRNAEARQQTVFEDLPEEDQPGLELKLAEWRGLPLEQRKQMFGGFRHYFELSEDEQRKILKTLSEPERQETEKVVNTIEALPRSQQEAYLTAFRQFAEMSSPERQNFMRNLRRWQRMSVPERQAWRDLVQQLPSAPRPPAGFLPRTEPTGPIWSAGAKSNPAVRPLK